MPSTARPAGSPEELAAVRHLVELGYQDPHEVAARKAVVQQAQAAQLGQAEGLLKQGKLYDAIALLERAAQAAPDWTACRHLLARAYFRSGQTERAAAELEWLEFHGVEHPELTLIRATTALARRRLDEALDQARYAKCLQDPLPAADLVLGEVHLRRGDLQTAASAYRSAADHGGNAASAHLGLAAVALQEGHFEVAAGHVLDAIERDQGLWLAHYRLGSALEQLHRLPEARVAFEAASRLNPVAASPHVALARISAAEGNPAAADEAIQLARQTVRQRRAERAQPRKS